MKKHIFLLTLILSLPVTLLAMEPDNPNFLKYTCPATMLCRIKPDDDYRFMFPEKDVKKAEEMTAKLVTQIVSLVNPNAHVTMDNAFAVQPHSSFFSDAIKTYISSLLMDESPSGKALTLFCDHYKKEGEMLEENKRNYNLNISNFNGLDTVCLEKLNDEERAEFWVKLVMVIGYPDWLKAKQKNVKNIMEMHLLKCLAELAELDETLEYVNKKMPLVEDLKSKMFGDK